MYLPFKKILWEWVWGGVWCSMERRSHSNHPRHRTNTSHDGQRGWKVDIFLLSQQWGDFRGEVNWSQRRSKWVEATTSEHIGRPLNISIVLCLSNMVGGVHTVSRIKDDERFYFVQALPWHLPESWPRVQECKNFKNNGIIQIQKHRHIFRNMTTNAEIQIKLQTTRQSVCWTLSIPSTREQNFKDPWQASIKSITMEPQVFPAPPPLPFCCILCNSQKIPQTFTQ